MTKCLLAGCLAWGVLAGCVEEPNYGSTAGMTFEEFKARTYREPGSGLYVLDWDTPVSGDAALYEVWEATVQGTLAVLNINGQDIVWSASQRKNLTYCVSDAFGSKKSTVIAALAAASDSGWEMMADVNYIYVPAQDANCNASNNNVMFDVNPVNSSGEYLARSFFPNSPRNERNVLIDNAALLPGGTGAAPLSNVLAHELGHTLGFRHEHIRPEANATQCAEDDDFRGLTAYDSASVMHYPQCNGTSQDLSFSSLDQQGVVAMYGPPSGGGGSPMTQINAPIDGAIVGPTFSVETSIIDSDVVSAELYIDGDLVDTLTTAPYTFEVANLAIGSHELEVVARDGTGQTTSRTVSITVTANGGNGGSPGDENGLGDQVSGGCNTGRGQTGSLALFALAGLVATRRRRRSA
jgi:MYXO-CTERM domain-containing protein